MKIVFNDRVRQKKKKIQAIIIAFLDRHIMKNTIFLIFYQVKLRESYFNKPGPEVEYFYIENVLEVTFSTLQNPKPQMPSFGSWLS